MTPYRPLLIAALAAAASLVGTAARANDFPTVARVLWVQDCLREHPGPNFEMINKCACAADRVADQLSIEQYDELSTAAKATTIHDSHASHPNAVGAWCPRVAARAHGAGAAR